MSTDRIIGALAGLACGDALGAGYEFQDAPADPIEMIGGGLGNWAPGEWTDDTSMAVCIADVTATGSVDLDAIAARFGDWFASDPPDVGVQTRAVLEGGGDIAARARAYHERNPRSSAGNGSLMRTAPVALAHLGDDDAIVAASRAVSALTHADPLCTDACVLWCIAIDRAVRFGRLDGVRDGLGHVDDGWAARLDEAESAPPASFKPNGFVVTALQAAYAAIVQTPGDDCRHFTEALRTAVRIGHDTDTVAAIAGMVLGARWGSSAIPLGWKAMIHGWPGYRYRDLVRLAVMTANDGRPDEIGWPTASDLSDRYGEPEPRWFALPDDDGVFVGNALAVRSADTDVVLSLCRTGVAQVPDGVEHHEVVLIDLEDANPNLDFVLRDCAEQIGRWRDAGKTVFVHCGAGRSRSPTVCAAYVARRLGVGGAEALARIASAVPGVRPNPGFLAALDRL